LQRHTSPVPDIGPPPERIHEWQPVIAVHLAEIDRSTATLTVDSYRPRLKADGRSTGQGSMSRIDAVNCRL
jgi:hypothetical protein